MSKRYEIRITNKEEYWSLLKEKLKEEVEEFLDSKEKEEITDILEVSYTICRSRG